MGCGDTLLICPASPALARYAGQRWLFRPSRIIWQRPRQELVLSKNPIDAVRRADSTLDARRVATFVTAESLC